MELPQKRKSSKQMSYNKQARLIKGRNGARGLIMQNRYVAIYRLNHSQVVKVPSNHPKTNKPD